MSYQSKTVEKGFARGPGRGMKVEKPKEGKKTLLRLIHYFRAEMKNVILLTIVVSAGVLAQVLGPRLQSDAIDRIVAGRFDEIAPILRKMLLVYATAGAAVLAQGYLGASLSQKVVKKLRADLFDKIVSLPVGYIDSHSHGDIMSRMTNDADNISTTISSSLTAFFSGALTLIGTAAMMFSIHVPLTLISLAVIALALLFTTKLTKVMASYYSKRQVILGQLNGVVEEMVSSTRTVTAYGLEGEAISDFSQTADRLTKTGIIADSIGNSMGPVHNIFNNLAFVGVAASGAYFALKGYVTVGVISAFLIYSRQISRPVSQLAELYGQIETAVAGAERIFALMDEKSEDRSGKPMKEKAKGNIEFCHVNFSYVPGKQVIHDFSLKIEAGKKIALVGATGSGKTTIINLLMRFYDADSGEILLDGENIHDIAVDDLRRSVGIVLQDTVLFSNTVRANLTYTDASMPEERVKKAAAAANADRMIRHLPKGYDTVLKQDGASLSQGQRQLIAIGRAFLTDPEVLILDEATSSVDTRTEKNIQDAMVKLMKDRTSLIIAHRLSTIQDADEIIVMDQGRIVEKGNHRELLEKKGRYWQLYQTQFAGKAI